MNIRDMLRKKDKKEAAEAKEQKPGEKRPLTAKERMEILLKALGNAMPYRRKLASLLVYAGYEKTDPVMLAGRLTMLSIILSFASLLLSVLFLPPLYSIVLASVVFIAPQGLALLGLMMKSDSLAKKVEDVLPDALQLISANIRAGMTLNRAIWLSARPEFGPLENVIRRVGAENLGGKTIENALLDTTKRIDSKTLDRAVKLIIEGIKSGGEMASLMEETSADIRVSQSIKEEIKSSVMMYSMFIIFASVLGAPSLFAVSIYFVKTTTSLWTAQNVDEYSQLQGGFFKPSTPTITAGDLTLFAIASIILSTAFGALIIGLIQSGKAQRGVSYIIPLAVAGLVVFFLASLMVNSLLGSLIVT